jgi:hypothetical protein
MLGGGGGGGRYTDLFIAKSAPAAHFIRFGSRAKNSSIVKIMPNFKKIVKLEKMI